MRYPPGSRQTDKLRFPQTFQIQIISPDGDVIRQIPGKNQEQVLTLAEELDLDFRLDLVACSAEIPTGKKNYTPKRKNKPRAKKGLN